MNDNPRNSRSRRQTQSQGKPSSRRAAEPSKRPQPYHAAEQHSKLQQKHASIQASPAERTLRSSEQINRIREQGARRVQVSAPKQPVNQAPQKAAAEKSKQSPNGSAPQRVNRANPRRNPSEQSRKNTQGNRTKPGHGSSEARRNASRKSGIQTPNAAQSKRVKQRNTAKMPDGRISRERRGDYVQPISSTSAQRSRSHAALNPKRRFPGRKLAVAAVLVLAVLVFSGVDGLINGNKIYSGVTIGDVSVEGLTKDEAVNKVSSEYSQRVASNVAMFFTSEENLSNPKNADSDANIEEQISYEESLANRTQWTVPASAVEATLDVDSLVDQAFKAGREDGGIFGRLKASLFGWQVDLTCSYNDTLLGELSDQMTSTVGNKRVNYDISIADGVASVTDGNDGNEVTVEWLTDHLNSTFLGTDANTKTVLETTYMPLQVSERDAQRVADTVNASIAAGATFTYNDQSWNASASDLGGLVTTSLTGEEDHWTLKPKFDEAKTKNALLSSLHSNIDSDGLEVSFSKSDDGQITVSSNAKGQAPMADEALADLNENFFVSETRTQTPQIALQSAEIPSSLSFDDAKSFGLITEISSFTTQYSSGNEARVNNIHTAADLLNNSIAKANGGSWSFNDTAGEATPEKGYEAAGAIVGSEYSDAIGGGICQVATTVYNSVYLAGYPVEKRYNHTLYIESYPKGRDAAIAYPDLDLVWKNDTASDVLLVMTYTSTSVTATLWGVDPGYQVSTEYGDWKKGEPYSTTYKTDKTVASGTEYVETTGVDGSSITIVRTVKDKDGNILHEDTFTSTYAPKNKVIVKGAA